MTQGLWLALIGGVCIGLASALLLWLNGRIAGNSGIIAQCWPSKANGWWRLAYVAGLVLGALLYRVAPLRTDLTYQPSMAGLIIAGLLVGIGTRLGSGCTSGHGICGIGRLSPRSMAATVIFVIAAMATVFVVKRMGGAWW